MVKKLIWISMVLIAGSLSAEDDYVISQQGFFRLRGIHQSYTIGSDSSLNEFSTPIEIYWPISRETSLFIYTSYADVTGQNMTGISGLSDTQISWNYYLEDQNLVFNLGLGMPTGKATLSAEEFTTSLYISQHYWNFTVPNFGQGFNLSPGVTWAQPLSDAAVMGLGLSYQIRGGFIPTTDAEAVYKPGNELLLTGGMDIRLGTLSTLTADLIFTSYGSDTYTDTVEVYKSGSKLVTGIQFKTYFGYDILSLLFRYRSRSKNQMLDSDGSGLVTESMKTAPNQMELSGHYRHRHSAAFFMSYGIEGRFYEETDVYKGSNLIGIALDPELKLSDKSRLFGQLKYWTGSYSTDVSLSGLEIGIGWMYLF
jgi:hypothetical protein